MSDARYPALDAADMRYPFTVAADKRLYGYGKDARLPYGAPDARKPYGLDLAFTSGVRDSRVLFTRAAPADYYDAAGAVQTAAADVPRFDHHPSTLAPRGLRLDTGEGVTLPLSSLSAWTGAAGVTLLVEAELAASTGGVNYLAVLDDGTANNRISLARAATARVQGAVVAAAAAQANFLPVATLGAGILKMALAYQQGSLTFTYNGVAPALTATGALPSGMTTLRLGNGVAGLQTLNGWLRRVAVVPYGLPAAELVAWTTL